MEDNQQRHEDKQTSGSSSSEFADTCVGVPSGQGQSSNCEYASWFSSYLGKAVHTHTHTHTYLYIYVCVHIEIMLVTERRENWNRLPIALYANRKQCFYGTETSW